jgi:hypothetical protein
MKEAKKRGEMLSVVDTQPLFMGQAVGLVDDVKSAKEIVEEMVHDAIETMEKNYKFISHSKL